MKRLLLLLALAGIYFQSQGQATSCAQTLRLARSTYEQGRLHELESILGPCLSSGFTTEEQVEAYKLLTLTYIYLEEPKKADETMRKVLETDHFFQINPEIDPAEFVALYKTFRTEPVYSLGAKFGPALIMPSVLTNYYTASDAAGSGEYSPGIGIQAGVTFEMNVFKKFSIAPELMFAPRQFSKENKLFSSDSLATIGGATEAVYKQTWIDLNAVVQYEISRNKDGSVITYAGLGPAVSLSLKQNIQLNTTGLSGSAVSGADVDVKDSFEQFFYSITALIGAKLRIGGIFVHGELRYQYGLSNVVNADSRTNLEVTLDYAAQHNDVRLNTITGALGVSLPIFKPAKLKIK